MTYTVYRIHDPINPGQTLYIGCTNKELSIRLQEKLDDGLIAGWPQIKEVEIQPVDTFLDERAAKQAQQELIVRHKPILNKQTYTR